MKEPLIPVYRPWLGIEEAQATHEPILSGWVTQGPQVAAFEKEFADYVEADNAIAVANCTVALHLALLVAGVTAGDEVITVSHSYIATANSIRYLNAIPVFVDIQLSTLNMNPDLLEKARTEKSKAILVVHQIGMPADMESILNFAKRHNLAVVEDAACAVGSEILWNGEWQKIGRPHADLACFSFHPRKLLTTGDGGMITTSNPVWVERLRRLRQHSMSVSDVVRHGSSKVIREGYPELGFNYRLTDIQASVGRVQLSRLPQLLARRRAQVEVYRQNLAGLPLTFQEQPSWARSNYQSVGIHVDPRFSQDEVMQRLLDLGISARRGIMNAHREEAYPADTWRGGPLPESERAQDQYILLPLFHELSEADQDRVIAALRQILK